MSGQNEAVRCTWETNKSNSEGKMCTLSLPVFYNLIPYTDDAGNTTSYNRITAATVRCELPNGKQTIGGSVNLFDNYYQTNAQGNFIDGCVLTIKKVGTDLQLIDASAYTEDNYKSLTSDEGFITSSSYKLIVTVTDAAGKSTQAEVFLNTIPYTMHLQRGGLGVAFGKMSERNKAVEIASDWKLYLGNIPFDSAKLEPATTSSTG